MEENKHFTTEEVANQVPAQDQQVVTTSERADTADTTSADTVARLTTKPEVIARLKQIATNKEAVARQELEQLKHTYYQIHSEEVKAAREAFIASGGEAEAFQPEADATEVEFKAQMNLIKEQRAQEAAKIEAEKQENLQRKLALIEKVKVYSESPETADKHYNDIKEVQTAWKSIQTVPAENATELWKTYHLYMEKFYDQLHLHHEARLYDFKKNLEAKTRLIEAAERLTEQKDVVSAFHQLQALHMEFRETGPVEKEKREEIWNRFKEASTIINKRHQAHFEELKAQEEENLTKKTALCEQMEGLNLTEAKTFKDWEELTEKVLAWQAEWKTIGFTPKKMNNAIFERFRTSCDAFFQKKAAFFKAQRESSAENLAAKRALAEEAEALKESTDWVATANKFIVLQKKWKEVGHTAHKEAEALWKRFHEAANFFFEKKAEATGQVRAEEEANLEKKKSIIAKLEALLHEENDNLREAVRTLQEEWNEVGHVPFKKKDALFKQYRAVCDTIFDELHINARRRSVENFRKKLDDKGGNELSRERQRLQNAYDGKAEEIKNYEANLSFFSAKSKAGNSMLEDIQRKIDRLKDELTEIGEKLQVAREKERETKD